MIKVMGESISDFGDKLKRLNQHCHFGDYLNDTLWDRLVCRLTSESIKRLLSESELRFRRAVELVIAMETAAKDSVESPSGRCEYSKLYKHLKLRDTTSALRTFTGKQIKLKGKLCMLSTLRAQPCSEETGSGRSSLTGLEWSPWVWNCEPK